MMKPEPIVMSESAHLMLKSL